VGLSPRDDDNGRLPAEGDVISARYRWSNGKDEPGEKIRPCVIVKVAKDHSSVIVAPVSTKNSWEAIDCMEIAKEDRAAAGVHSEKRSWVKLTEVNRFDLPNLAIVPHTNKKGEISWRRGRVKPELLRALQAEIAHRTVDKSLKGVRVRSDNIAALKISARPRSVADGTLSPEDRDARIRAAAQARLDREKRADVISDPTAARRTQMAR